MRYNRRDFLRICAVSTLFSMLPIRQLLAILEYRKYHQCFPDFLKRLATDAYQLRNARLKELADQRSIREYQDWARQTFWKLIGGKLEKTPLNSRITRSFERDQYRVENIIIESQPGFHIPGNVYIPTQGDPPYPGILFQMGHALNGKAARDYQRCCIGLVKLGFLVFGFDPMGQGERAYYPRPDGYMTRLPSADTEHTLPGRQMILIGDTSTRLQVWDAIRSLDFLESHPLVDSSRLASTGNSGGATLTMLLAAVDDRIKVAALSCGNTENHACRDFIAPGSTDDAEQNILNGGSNGFDRWDLLYPFAPKPLLFLNSSRDFFGTYSPNYLESGREEYEKLKKIYISLGHSDHIQWIETPMPHNLAYYFRLEIYRWMLRWLKDSGQTVDHEPEVTPEEDRILFAGTSGNVVNDYNGQTPFSLNLKRAARISTPDSIESSELIDLLKIDMPSSTTKFEHLGIRQSGDLRLEALEVKSDESVWVPAWIFHPQSDSRGTVIIVEPYGRSVRWKEDGLYQNLARNGITVCAPDMRWIGDLRPEYSKGARNHASWHQDEEAWSWASLMLGRPLLGQRVTDLLAVISAVKSTLGTNRIVLAARSHVSVPALIAAALDPEIHTVLLTSGLISFRSIVEHEDYDHPFGNFVFGILLRTDIPHISALLKKRRLIMAGPVDSRGKPVPQETVKMTYSATENLELIREPKWNLEVIESLFQDLS